MTVVSAEELTRIPFVTNPPRDGRAMILVPFFDETSDEWHAYWKRPGGELVRLDGGQVVQGTYLGRRPADPGRDYEFFLGTFITQHLSFPSVAQRYVALQTTVHHLSACLEKFQRFSSAADTNGATLLVESELAHLAMLVRRFYDLLQKIAKDAGALVKDVQDPSRRLFEKLPDSFADMALRGDRPRTAEEIVAKWKLAPPIAAFYAAEAEHFLLIRAIRVAIEHHGQSPGLVVALPEGMAVVLRVPPWDKLPIWNESTTRRNELGSVRALFAYLINDVLDLSSRFVRSYWSCIGTPPAIAEGFRCFLRSAFSHHLVALPQMLTQAWERR